MMWKSLEIIPPLCLNPMKGTAQLKQKMQADSQTREMNVNYFKYNHKPSHNHTYCYSYYTCVGFVRNYIVATIHAESNKILYAYTYTYTYIYTRVIKSSIHNIIYL